MKTRFLSIMLICMFVICYGCNDNPSDVTPTEQNNTGVSPTESEPESYLFLVKFKDDKYREQIIAEKIYNPVRMRGTTPPVVEELIVETIPWVDKLPNGYWIANWRWGYSLLYPSTNVLLPDKWESMTHWTQTWPMPEEIVPFHDYIEEVGSVRRRDIDTLLTVNTNVKSGTEEYFFLYGIPVVYGRRYTTKEDILDFEKDSYFTYVHQQDSLHEIYVQRLMDITTNGNFKKVYKKIFE